MRARTVFVVGSLASMGCTALIGVRDIYLDENAEGGASSSSSGSSSSSSGNGGQTDGGPDQDGAACNANLDTDSKNCGRCGRDCLGSECKAGKCDPITLAGSLVNPTSAVTWTDKLIVTSYGDGRILEVPKTPGTVRVITTVKAPWGAIVEGNTLYFADSDTKYDGVDLTRKGGIWRCDLPACAAPTLITPAEEPVNPVLVGGVLYFAENNADEVTRVLPDGGGKFVLDTTNNPWTVQADGAHVYYTSSQPSFWRVPLPDGGGEIAGPQGFYAAGGLALDNDRYYYSYTAEGQDAGAGHVVSFTKANAGQGKLEYGADNIVPRGVIVDDKYVYWVNSGTFDETFGAATHFDGQLRACPKAGCPATGPIVLATGLGRPWELGQDATAIYVCVYGNYQQAGGAVLKIAKP